MSGEIENNELSLKIDQLLLEFSHTNSNHPSIFRVSDCLRSTNEKAFDPMIITIGPFHHGKGHLKSMEHLKMRYLKQLAGESSVIRYASAIRGKEEAARNFYAEEIELNADEFEEMLLLDGIFIIEFLREYNKKGNVVSWDNVILRDLMLFENQIPLTILLDLFNLSKNDKHERFIDLIWPALSPIHAPDPDSELWPINADHLLGLVHRVRCCSFAQTLTRESANNDKMECIHSATELKEDGIEFKKPNNDTSWLDITFKNKTIYIPEFEISDVTESWFRNMIAYEHYLPSNSPRYISDYAFFLQCLMHSSDDAELLRYCGVISNWLGGDGRVYELINRIGTNVQTSENFSYLDVFRSINHHCGLRRNRWFAALRRTHLSNPWTLISLVAAAVLLSVALVQTVFAILSYYHD